MMSNDCSMNKKLPSLEQYLGKNLQKRQLHRAMGHKIREIALASMSPKRVKAKMPFYLNEDNKKFAEKN